MRFKGTAAFLNLVKALRETNGHEFQRAAYNLLKQAWPDLQYAPDLVSRFDRQGIDLYDGANPNFDLVVQCKSAVGAFEAKHVKLSLASIKKFKKSGYRCRSYWLVLNTYVHDQQMRKQLDTAIAELKALQVAGDARWMDVKTFVEVAFGKVVEDLRQALPRHNRDYLVRYAGLMREGRAYMPRVPSTHIVRHATPSRGRKQPSKVWHTKSLILDPLSLLRSQFVGVSKATIGPTQVRSYRLLISEFGFGKTSLLLEFTNTLNAGQRLTIYVPMAELPADAFRSEFVSAVFALIRPEASSSTNSDYLPFLAFRYLLRSNQTLVLVLDGLDEHSVSYTVEGLSQIFGCIRDLVCDVVISSRAEFWINNQGTLDNAMKGTGDNRQSFVLEEWDSEAMLSYLEEFSDRKGIVKLKTDIAHEQYTELYGDIPRRPLFLEMLADYLEDQDDAPFSLVELYARALERKLERDIDNPFASPGTISRPLPLPDVDLNEQRRRMLSLLAQLAGSTIRINVEFNRVEIAEAFYEGELLRIARDVGLAEARSVNILLHSVIVSTNRRSDSGELQYKFAHRSYQEYFIARFVVETGWTEDAELPSLVNRFVTELNGGHTQRHDSFIEEFLI